jgi:uncharacterized protein YjbI with pentapeptide repeats
MNNQLLLGFTPAANEYATFDWANVNYDKIDWRLVDFSKLTAAMYEAIDWANVNHDQVDWSKVDLKKLGDNFGALDLSNANLMAALNWSKVDLSALTDGQYAIIDWSSPEFFSKIQKNLSLLDWSKVPYYAMDWSLVDFKKLKADVYEAIDWANVNHDQVDWSKVDLKKLGDNFGALDLSNAKLMAALDWSKVDLSALTSGQYAIIDWSSPGLVSKMKKNQSQLDWAQVPAEDIIWSEVDFKSLKVDDYEASDWATVDFTDISIKRIQWKLFSSDSYNELYKNTLDGVSEDQKTLISNNALEFYGKAGVGDIITGNKSNNIISGTSLYESAVNQIDTLTGGSGKDVFILGDSTNNYYTNDGENGYAIITDFTIGQDKVQLQGAEYDNYYLSDPITSGAGYYVELSYDLNSDGVADDKVAEITTTNRKPWSLDAQVSTSVNLV